MAKVEQKNTVKCRLRASKPQELFSADQLLLSAQGLAKPAFLRIECDTVERALHLLEEKLASCVQKPEEVDYQNLAAIVTAVSLARICFRKSQKRRKKRLTKPTYDEPCSIPAESVVDFAQQHQSPDAGLDNSTEDFIWRRELETLWKKHLSKDEFHRPVVKSLGIPVLAIVEQVRKGHAWRAICDAYQGLVYDDIRACVSMATECGWLTNDELD